MYQKRTYQCRGRFEAQRTSWAESAVSSSGEVYFAEPGDWIVERGGCRFALSDACFRAMFEPIAGERPEGWEN